MIKYSEPVDGIKTITHVSPLAETPSIIQDAYEIKPPTGLPFKGNGGGKFRPPGK